MGEKDMTAVTLTMPIFESH